jgi:hypothetical protein
MEYALSLLLGDPPLQVGGSAGFVRRQDFEANGNPMLQNEVADCIVFPSRYGDG